MGGTLSNYNFGGDGVNLVKDPLELADAEATQLQNAEKIPDQATGGEGSLTKRQGLAALGSALSGAVYGGISLPLQTTFTRTLYASLGTFDSNKWTKTTNGTSWTDTASPARATKHDNTNYEVIGTAAQAGSHRGVTYKTQLIYPGDGYTADVGTPGNNTALPLMSWDGTTALTIVTMPVGSSSSDGNSPFSVSDMVQANGKIYFCLHDPANANPMKGRVMAFNPATSELTQVATPFGFGTGFISGGAPCCIAWHQGQLFVGLDNGDGTANVGKVVRCYPDIDTDWTSDTAVLLGYPKSLCVYQGDLYVGMRGNATNDAKVYKRSQSTGAWAASDTTTTSGIDYYGSLTVYGDDLYAVVFSDGGSDVELIRKLSGGTWSTDRDVAATDCTAGAAQHVGMGAVYGSDLFFAFKATSDTQNDGFILRKSGGTWTKVLTDNINGRLLTLTERS